MIITDDRLDEMLFAPREAMIAKAEIKDLVTAYKNQAAQMIEITTLAGKLLFAKNHLAELESIFEHATGYSFDGYMRMLDEVKERKS